MLFGYQQLRLQCRSSSIVLVKMNSFLNLTISPRAVITGLQRIAISTDFLLLGTHVALLCWWELLRVATLLRLSSLLKFCFIWRGKPQNQPTCWQEKILDEDKGNMIFHYKWVQSVLECFILVFWKCSHIANSK